MTAGTRQLDRTAGQDSRDSTVRTGRRWQNWKVRNRTSWTGQPGQASWVRTLGTGQPVHDGLTGLPGQASLDRSASQTRQISLERSAGTVQLGKLSLTGRSGQASLDRSTWKDRNGQDRWDKSAETGHPGQVRQEQDSSVWTGQTARSALTGQPERLAWTG